MTDYSAIYSNPPCFSNKEDLLEYLYAVYGTNRVRHFGVNVNGVTIGSGEAYVLRNGSATCVYPTAIINEQIRIYTTADQANLRDTDVRIVYIDSNMDISETTVTLDASDTSTYVTAFSANECYYFLYAETEQALAAANDFYLEGATSANVYIDIPETYNTWVPERFVNFTSQTAYMCFIRITTDNNLNLYIHVDTPTPNTSVKLTDYIDKRLGFRDIFPFPIKSGGTGTLTAKYAGTNCNVNCLIDFTYVKDS